MNKNKTKTFKTFNDLKFKKHPVQTGLQAFIFFKNGFGVSVVRFKNTVADSFKNFITEICSDSPGYGSYTSNEKEWELAVVKKEKKGFSICYNTGITDDVLGHLSARKVSAVMKKVQQLKKSAK